MFLGDFCKLNRTSNNGTCLEKPPGGFCDVGYCCCCFTSLEVFTFPGYFLLPPALHSGFSDRWRPPPALRCTLATFGCFTFAKVFRHNFPGALQFGAGVFYPQAFLILHSFLTFRHIFVTQMRIGTPHPGSSSVPDLAKLSLPADAWSWTTHIVDTRRLVYQLR